MDTRSTRSASTRDLAEQAVDALVRHVEHDDSGSARSEAVDAMERIITEAIRRAISSAVAQSTR